MLVPEISSSADVVPWKQRKRFYIRANTDSSSHRPQSHLDVLFCTLAVVVHMNNPHPVKVIFCQCMLARIYRGHTLRYNTAGSLESILVVSHRVSVPKSHSTFDSVHLEWTDGESSGRLSRVLQRSRSFTRDAFAYLPFPIRRVHLA